MWLLAVARAQGVDSFRVGDKPGVANLRSTLQRLWGVIRPRPLGACEKAVGTFPAKGYVGVPSRFL